MPLKQCRSRRSVRVVSGHLGQDCSAMVVLCGDARRRWCIERGACVRSFMHGWRVVHAKSRATFEGQIPHFAKKKLSSCASGLTASALESTPIQSPVCTGVAIFVQSVRCFSSG